MKRLLVAVLSLVLLGTATACSDSTSPGASLSGTYTLRTVNGASLPMTLCDNSGCYDVLSAQITLDANGNYQSVSQYSDGTDTFTGRWSLSGNQLTLIDDFDGFASNATVSGGTLTFTDFAGGISTTAVYSK